MPTPRDEQQADELEELRARKRKRCFQRVMSGLEKGGELRLVTLTSSEEAPNDIKHSFSKLVKRMRRRGLVRDYIRVIELTERGYFHIHMIYRGHYIAQRELSREWQDIHQSPIVDIRKVDMRPNSKRRVGNYLAKYMSKDAFSRYSWSWGWVYKGFVKIWTLALQLWRKVNASSPKYVPFSRHLAMWQLHLRKGIPKDLYLDFYWRMIPGYPACMND